MAAAEYVHFFFLRARFFCKQHRKPNKKNKENKKIKIKEFLYEKVNAAHVIQVKIGYAVNDMKQIENVQENNIVRHVMLKKTPCVCVSVCVLCAHFNYQMEAAMGNALNAPSNLDQISGGKWPPV